MDRFPLETTGNSGAQLDPVPGRSTGKELAAEDPKEQVAATT
jgi:hypothetical protein